MLPAAVVVLQWVYAVRFAWPVWVAVGLAAAVVAVAADPVACRPVAGEPGGGGALAGRAVRGGHDDGASAGGRHVLRPRVGRALQSPRASPAAAVRGRGADRLVCVLSRSAASRRAEGGSSSAVSSPIRRRGCSRATSSPCRSGNCAKAAEYLDLDDTPTSRSGTIGSITLRSRKRLE